MTFEFQPLVFRAVLLLYGWWMGKKLANTVAHLVNGQPE